MGNMIPVCTERDHSCKSGRTFSTPTYKTENLSVIFDSNDYYSKQTHKKRHKKRHIKNNIK